MTTLFMLIEVSMTVLLTTIAGVVFKWNRQFVINDLIAPET